MKTSELLKCHRLKQGMTQEELAKALFVSRQAVSKWERGETYPDIANVIALSDLYDISIDVLLRGSSFLKKPYVIGYQFTRKHFLGAILSIGFFAFLMSSMNPYLFLIAFVSAWLTLITIANDGQWTINQQTLQVKTMEKFTDKFMSFFNKDRFTIVYTYDQITKITLFYLPTKRISVYDFRPDYFALKLTTKDGKEHTRAIDWKIYYDLPLLTSFLEKKEITIDDPKHLIEVLASGGKLFDYVRQEG